MRKYLAVPVVMIALLGVAATASADTAPAGFHRAMRLEPAASWVAGKSVRVWCATSKAAFTAGAAGESITTTDATGFADSVGGTNAYLVPLGCAALTAWLNHRHVEDYTFAASALLLAHEATHLRGVADEGATDCAALAKLPAMIRRFFPIKGHGIDLATLMMYAKDAHQREPDAYQGDC